MFPYKRNSNSIAKLTISALKAYTQARISNCLRLEIHAFATSRHHMSGYLTAKFFLKQYERVLLILACKSPLEKDEKKIQKYITNFTLLHKFEEKKLIFVSISNPGPISGAGNNSPLHRRGVWPLYRDNTSLSALSLSLTVVTQISFTSIISSMLHVYI